MSRLSLSPLRYPGGKSRALNKITALLPSTIGEFREPFVGGGSVFLGVKKLFQSNIQRYWINDLNYDLYCFWHYAQCDIERLVAGVRTYRAKFPVGREMFTFYSDPASAPTEFDKAVRFFIMNRITFSGVTDAGGYSQEAFEKRFTLSSIERLEQVAFYLKNITITCGDYAPLVEQPGENVFLFLDPPYLSATESRLYGKRGNLHTSFDHERFADTMRRCSHRWLITYDDSPRVRELFSFANIVEWELQYGMNNYKQGKADKGQELFIKNF